MNIARDNFDKPTKAIVVDAGTKGNPGEAFYRGMDLETGKILFEANIGVATNNIAEFFAVCHAYHFREKNGLTLDIYSDSVTAISWFRNGRHVSTFKDEKIIKRLDEACAYAKTIDYKIKKWETKIWGEIPADYGRK